MTLSYENVFEYFLGYVTDFNFPNMEQQDVDALLSEYLQKALSKSYVRRLFSEYENRQEIMRIKFEMKNPTSDEEDVYFVTDILAKGMVIEWLQPQVKSKLLTAQVFAGKEQKFYAQANQLSEMRALLEDTEIEQRKLIRDRGYIYNDYLDGVV